MAKHYTAVLEIIESNKIEDKDCGHSSYSTCRCTKSTKKTTSEVARIVVRGTDLTQLKRKLAAHVELVDDDPANDLASMQIERKPRGI